MAVHDFRSQRLYVEHPLNESTKIEMSREQANYLINVLRMKTGDHILVFNGKDGEWQMQIEATGRKKCHLVSVQQMRGQLQSKSLIYCFAPLKQARLDYMIQKAVEMGVSELQPVITQHTQVRKLNEKRVIANTIEAAEQCGILCLPKIKESVQLANLLEHLGKDTHLIFCDEVSYDADAIDLLKTKKYEKLAILIGPEGGFSEDERNYLSSQQNVTKLGLGPRILRADTAAIAALALVQAHLGDWYNDNI